MSATIKYKGNTIATITTDSSKTLKTSGKYCEGDIVVENVQDGGGGSALSFTSQAVGMIPEYQVGHAVSVLEINTNMFTSSAVGSLTE